MHDNRLLLQVLSGRTDVLSKRVMDQVLDRSELMSAWQARRADPSESSQTKAVTPKSSQNSDADSKLFKIIDEDSANGLET